VNTCSCFFFPHAHKATAVHTRAPAGGAHPRGADGGRSAATPPRRYAFGECYYEVTKDQCEELLEAKKEKVAEQMAALEVRVAGRARAHLAACHAAPSPPAPPRACARSWPGIAS